MKNLVRSARTPVMGSLRACITTNLSYHGPVVPCMVHAAFNQSLQRSLPDRAIELRTLPLTKSRHETLRQIAVDNFIMNFPVPRCFQWNWFLGSSLGARTSGRRPDPS